MLKNIASERKKVRGDITIPPEAESEDSERETELFGKLKCTAKQVTALYRKGEWWMITTIQNARLRENAMAYDEYYYTDRNVTSEIFQKYRAYHRGRYRWRFLNLSVAQVKQLISDYNFKLYEERRH